MKLLFYTFCLFLTVSCKQPTEQNQNDFTTDKKRYENCSTGLVFNHTNKLSVASENLHIIVKNYLKEENDSVIKQYELFLFDVFDKLGHNSAFFFSKMNNSIDDTLILMHEENSYKLCNKIAVLKLLSRVRTPYSLEVSIDICLNSNCDINKYNNIKECLNDIEFNVICLSKHPQELEIFAKEIKREGFKKDILEEDCSSLLNLYLIMTQYHTLRDYSIMSALEKEIGFRLDKS